jgi:hypothetical protein
MRSHGGRGVGEEAARVPGADGGGPAAWRGVRASTGRWTADFGRSAAADNPVGQRTTVAENPVGAAKGGGRGG